MTRFGTILFSCAFLLLFCKSYCEFPSEFLGNYVSDEEYNKRNFCWTPVCIKDSGLLIYDADHNSNKTLPCYDFKTFAMGEFFEHRVLGDRYGYTGFTFDLKLQYWERQKRMMLKPVKQSDPRIFKALKKVFRQCFNSSEFFGDVQFLLMRE